MMSSDEEEEVEEVPIKARALRERKVWLQHYEQEIIVLWEQFIADGQSMFGTAFWQLGTMNEFADMIFKYTQPGA